MTANFRYLLSAPSVAHRHQIEALYAAGPRVLADSGVNIDAVLFDLLESYNHVPPMAWQATGATEFPPWACRILSRTRAA